MPIFADDGEDDVLGRDAARALAGDVDFHRLGFELRQTLRREHVFDFAGADAEGERAHGAVRRGVAVAADNRAARLGDAEFRADDVHDALIAAAHVEQVDAKFLAIARQRVELRGGVGIGHGDVAVFRRDGVVHHREGQIGAAHFAARGLDAGKRLRGSAFVDEVPVNVDQRGFAGFFADHVRVPDFFVQCAGSHER